MSLTARALNCFWQLSCFMHVTTLYHPLVTQLLKSFNCPGWIVALHQASHMNDMLIPCSDFAIAHGASRFATATRVADLKRKSKTGREHRLFDCFFVAVFFSATGETLKKSEQKTDWTKLLLIFINDLKKLAQKSCLSRFDCVF